MGWSDWQECGFPYHVRPMALAAATEDSVIRAIAREERTPGEGDLYELHIGTDGKTYYSEFQ